LIEIFDTRRQIKSGWQDVATGSAVYNYFSLRLRFQSQPLLPCRLAPKADVGRKRLHRSQRSKNKINDTGFFLDEE
jgi:hypothetical protein